MSFIKEHFIKFELSAILILVMLLFLQSGNEPTYEASVLDAQHKLPTEAIDVEPDMNPEGIITPGNSVLGESVLGDESNNVTDTVTPEEGEQSNGGEMTGDEVSGGDTPDSGDGEGGNPEEDDKLSPEVQAIYDEVMNYTIPENIAFANVQESLSIRKSADGESKQIGILFPGNYCIVESVDGEWAKVTTGKVSGYCRVKYLICGDAAVTYAKEHVICTVKTKANANIRSSATTLEANILMTVTPGTSFNVITAAVVSEDPTTPLFVEIAYEGKTAYLAMSLANISYSWKAGQAYKETTNVEVQGTSAEKDDSTEAKDDIDNTPDVNASADLRADIVAVAKSALGTKYVYGGNSLTNGVDCSGFVHEVFKKAGAEIIKQLPRSSRPMSKSTLGKKITFEEARPGDLMFYGSGGKKTVDHVAIYIGDGKIIHASSVDKKVVIEDWDYRIPLVIRNFLG